MSDLPSCPVDGITSIDQAFSAEAAEVREVSRKDEPDLFDKAYRFMREGVFVLAAAAGELEEDTPDAGDRIVIAEDANGDIAAAGLTHPISDSEFSLGLLHTSKASREHGIGTRVVERLEKIARDAGATSMDVEFANEEAARFFSHRGYKLATVIRRGRSEHIKHL